MANSRSSKKPTTSNQSGLSRLPKLLPSPKLITLDAAPPIQGLLCYVISHYGTSGISVLIYREPKKDDCTVLCGDWQGNPIDLVTKSPNRLTERAYAFVQNDLQAFLKLMHTARIEMAQFFFAIGPNGLILVDIQKSQNTLVGPGMIRDLFSNICQTQEVRKVEVIDDRAYEYLQRGTGTYDGDIIIKPSKFRTVTQTGAAHQPLYVEIRR